jgi:hypothetical protein
MMLSIVWFTLILSGAAGVQSPALPATPQGKHLQAYLDAFNSGGEKTYLAMMETHVEPGLLKKRTVEERAQLFQRMRGDFGTLKVAKVVQASADQIDLAIPDKEGTEATFSFTFEPAAPFRIAGIRVEVDR